MAGSFVRRAAGIAWLLALLALALGGQRVLAADPSASPSADACPDQVAVWFDAPLPPEVPAGRQIPIGMTLWDCRQNGMPPADGAEVRVHPKTGKDKPATVRSRSDWPGHLTATIEVPAGGLGAIEVGFTGQECHDDGTCRDVFFPFATGGFGPPPEAPLAALVNAHVMPQPDPIVAGRTFEVDVAIEPRADWEPPLSFPDRMVVEAEVVRGGTQYRSDALRAPGSDAPYTGRLTVPEAGDYVLHAGFPGNGAPDQMIDGVATRITIEPGDGGTESAPSAPAGTVTAPSEGPSVPIVLIAGALAVGAIALVVRRVFADL